MASDDIFRDIVVGYPKLAAKTEIQPEVAIYRRFGALNAQNLLYYQAELTYLEEKIREIQVNDHNQKGRKAKYAKDWYWLKASEGTGDSEQLDLVLKLRETLRQYNKALVQQSVILNYPKPGKWDLEYLQDYLHTPEMGPLALEGEDATIWGSHCERKAYKPDLIALRPREKKDPFSKWAAETTIKLLKYGCTRFMKEHRVHGVIGYEDRTIYRITYGITCILASLLPIASIVILYCVHWMPARLATIASFNTLIAVCLMSLARAKPSEVFAITAAFAAVQVVFVGSDRSTLDCAAIAACKQ